MATGLNKEWVEIQEDTRATRRAARKAAMDAVRARFRARAPVNPTLIVVKS
jgi:hypothetical protein